ncbi:MAG: 3-deoxy-manno-octulosonate cytidylyltransferase [Alphaproteobacteria bacterium]|nr:3-deoxy-manno-octulosonate cytidylyltransferase [Alphaproteobacteria bacterium]
MNKPALNLSNPILLIPARMQASRLPGKPMANIAGKPMIVHVWERAVESGLGRVVVAAAEQQIVDAINAAGGEAVLTDANLPTGSDRIYQALSKLDPNQKHDAVINVQGDVPTLESKYIRTAYETLQTSGADIATLITPIVKPEDIAATQIVKAVVELAAGAQTGRAHYFTRVAAPWGDGPYYCHVGLYAYRRDALERFVKYPRSTLEQREGLEQLRALAMGLRIDAAVIDTLPLGVDTPEDLEKARIVLGRKHG